jgi:lipopolysaccharide transport system ATP-binding protein
MQARLQFACATAIRPDLLIIDEILGAGDAYFSVKSSQRMERLTKSGCTLLLVSHSMSQILQFCERCIWIDAGRVRADGPVRQVVGEYEVHMETLAAGVQGSALRLGTSGVNGPENKLLSADPSTSQAVALESGEKVLRWPGEPGPKLARLDIRVNGEETRRFAERSVVEFHLSLRNDRGAPVACRYQITVLSLDNRRITRLLSPIDQFPGEPGEVRQVIMALNPCLLNAGQYYINFAILTTDALQAGTPLRRYDLVSRFADFEITRTLDYRDPTVFSHPSAWVMGETGPGDPDCGSIRLNGQRAL